MTATTTNEYPIDCTAEEVRGILDGTLTQLLRPVEPQPQREPQTQLGGPGDGWLYDGQFFDSDESMQSHLFHDVYGGDKGMPYGGVYGDGSADRLWVREALKPKAESACNGEPRGVWAYYVADDTCCPENRVIIQAIPAKRMPRWASRLTLELVEVDVVFNEGWHWSLAFKRI